MASRRTRHAVMRLDAARAADHRGAGTRGRDDCNKPVSLVDIAPTILRAAGVAPPGDEGRVWGRGFGATGQPDLADLCSETEYPRVSGWSPLQALTDGRWMTILAGASTEVYDLQSDPREAHDVAAAQVSLAARDGGACRRDSRERQLRRAATRFRRKRRSACDRLGYVASSAQPATMAGAPNPAARIAVWNALEDALFALGRHQRGGTPHAAAARCRRIADSACYHR